jgi:PKD repeat protein
MTNRIPFPVSGTMWEGTNVVADMDFTGVTAIRVNVKSAKNTNDAELRFYVDNVYVGKIWGHWNTTEVKSLAVNFTGIHSLKMLCPIGMDYENAIYSQLSADAPDSVAPVANFSYSINGLSVTFTDLSTGSPTSWAWERTHLIGSSVQSPTLTFPTYGVYQVKLTATNATGSNTIYKTINIPNPAFSHPSGSISNSSVQKGLRTHTIVISGFKKSDKIRIISGNAWGIINSKGSKSKNRIVSITGTQVVFQFYFESYFVGQNNVAIFKSDKWNHVYENCITITE